MEQVVFAQRDVQNHPLHRRQILTIVGQQDHCHQPDG